MVDNIKEKEYDAPPDDLCNDFPRHVVDWLAKYDVSIPEALKHGWKYSPSKDQLVFLFKDGEETTEAWQARNFYSGSKTKYYNQGPLNSILPIFHSEMGGRQLVVVEDVVSAARISRQSDVMPCLGSHLPIKKIIALKAFYEVLVVWLDHDKLRESREITEKAKWLGMSARTIYTELDPKEYSDAEITEKLQTS